METNIDLLSSIIAESTKNAFKELFRNNEHYYYCVLLTTEEGLTPFISAWSWEALENLSTEHSVEYAQIRKWSYADSPYYNFGEEYFQPVRILFEQRPTIDELDTEAWYKEFDFRLSAMEIAMNKLDNDGLFAINQPRESVYINVELMPPDKSNTKRALRLNKREHILDWIREAAEE